MIRAVVLAQRQGSMTTNKLAISLIARRKAAKQRAWSHPGAVPDIDQAKLDSAISTSIEHDQDVNDDNAIFNFGVYGKKQRSEQIDAHGLMKNEDLIMILAQTGTGLRFKPLMLQKAFVTAIAQSKKSLNMTKNFQ